ncbi:precorrin-6y C5,15-methyltransferase (decarboxylating) subunit CbiE [Alteribacillus iranensis]|uniref:Precorrin-6Y C5,15-methyltransferase (Decarboxylating) n=1 Tax=Alteribacillus iranensis TaxID=930128 RepID=A0A1I2B5U7_9BACI|nr:precorrin-6y C5,15-methyltransferase (decarboxylating) subunit CbiE [Alteribacillus iranensis]SFE51446.1 precorrin-6Y C5,15-methyltransferase (decarboxylating) [Alteribacillus iranensis]
MTIKVIGIGEDGGEALHPTYREWIMNSSRLAGGHRQLAFFPEYKGEKVVLEGGLRKTIDAWREDEKDTVVLASGDPLFYGIGAYLAKKLPEVHIYPSMSSIQLAFAKIKESWHDASFVSVHGRSLKGLAQRIDGKKKVCLLTDKENTPAVIARYLDRFGMDEYRMCIAEVLGGEKEKVTWLSLPEAFEYEADPLNVVILKTEHRRKKQPLGYPDHMFMQRKPDKGLITKKEVRVLSLAALQLQKDSTVWDIGTCTGSVAIEAAHMASEGEVYAIEKNADDVEFARENSYKLRADLNLYHGKAPEYLDEWPDPDAIFLGGTGGNIRELLTICVNRLRLGGRIVLNAATIETLHEAMSLFKQLDCEVEITMSHLARSKPILHMTRFEGLNPVYIMTASKKEET